MCYQSVESTLERFGKYRGKGFTIKRTERGFYNATFDGRVDSVHDYNLSKLLYRVQLCLDGLWF